MVQFGFSSRLFYLQGGPEEDVPVIEVPIPSKANNPPPPKKNPEEEQTFLQELRELKETLKSDGIRPIDDEDGTYEEEDYSLLKQTIDALHADEDDDFYDRSKKKQNQMQTDSYETLVSKEVMLEKIHNTMLFEIEYLKKQIASKESSSNNQVDDLDSFMNNLQDSPEDNAILKKQQLMKEINKELIEIRKFIELVKPIGNVKINPKALKKAKLQIVDYVKDFYKKYTETNMKQANKKRKNYTFDDLFGGDKKPEAQVESTNEKEVISSQPENNDKVEVHNDDKPKDSKLTVNKLKDNKPPVEIPKPKTTPFTAPKTSQEAKYVAPIAKPVKKRKKVVSEDADYESWAPPVNQTGDGTTSLNEKLGY